MVSIVAAGNSLQSFRDHTFLYEKLYTGKPDLGKKANTSSFVVVAYGGPQTWLYITITEKLKSNKAQVANSLSRPNYWIFHPLDVS